MPFDEQTRRIPKRAPLSRSPQPPIQPQPIRKPWHWSWTEKDWPELIASGLFPVFHWLVGAGIAIIAGMGAGFIIAVLTSAGTDAISTSIVASVVEPEWTSWLLPSGSAGLVGYLICSIRGSARPAAKPEKPQTIQQTKTSLK